MSADYTRTIVFKVEDQAIKRATDRITRSLSNIERSLKKIETKGFTGLAKGAEKASKEVFTASESIGALTQQTKLLKQKGGEALKTIGNRFKEINKGITVQPFKGLVEELTKVPYVAKRSYQDIRTLVEFLFKGGKDIYAFVAGITALTSNVKNLFVNVKTNLTQLGTALDKNATKTENFLNKMVLGIKMQNTAFALAQNTALAQQKSLPATVRRNIARSRVGREGSGFSAFSSGAGEYNPYKLATPTPRYGAGRVGPIHPTQHYALQSNPYMGKHDNATQKSIARHAKKHNLKIETLLGQISANTKWGGRNGVTGFTAGQYGPQEAPLTRMEKWGFGNRANKKGWAASSGGKSGRMKGAMQSGMIGGGFPLLFGQSGLASTLGGIGGAVGGALSPGFGFAGSIVATAAAQKIQEMIDFRKAVDKLNVSIRATGGTSVFTAASVTKFAKSLGMTKDEALSALTAFQQFEASARIALTTVFGSESMFNMAAGFKDNAYLIGQMNQLSQATSLEQAKTALAVLKTKGLREAEVATLELLIKKQQELTREETKKSSIGFWDKMNPLRGMFEFGAIRKNGSVGGMSVEELREARTDKFTKEDFPRLLAEAKERLELQRDFNDQLERMAIIKAPEDELKKLLDPLKQMDALANTIGESFQASFKGLIKGTVSVEQAFANMFNRIGDHFLDMAARMIVWQIKMKLLGIFLPSIGSQVGNDLAGHLDKIPGKAAGGPVTGGKSYVVGEEGPELFVPGANGNIIPNHDLGRGGGTSVVVNVDASGSSVEGDEADARELGNMLASAIQAEIVRQKRPGGLLA